MQLIDLQPNSKITNKEWYELIVDKIIGDEIYTSWWNMKLNKFDRLRRTTEQIQKQIDSLWRTLLDWKIRITKNDFINIVLNKIGNVQIKEFISDAKRSDEDIINKKLVKDDVVYIWEDWIQFKFIWYIEEWTLFSIWNDENEINIVVEDKNLKHFSFEKRSLKQITLEEAFEKIYWLPISMLVLSD